MLETREALRLAQGNLPLDGLQRAIDTTTECSAICWTMRRAWICVPFEHYLLILDYRIMQAWYRLRPKPAGASDEMAGVVSHIAYKMGERAASFS